MIEDNGVGIAPEELQVLVRRLYGTAPEQTEHVGLYNCYKRLHLMFGERLSFQLKSQKDTGTKITIQINEVI